MSRDRVWNQKTSYGYIGSDFFQKLEKKYFFPIYMPLISLFLKKSIVGFLSGGSLTYEATRL